MSTPPLPPPTLTLFPLPQDTTLEALLLRVSLLGHKNRHTKINPITTRLVADSLSPEGSVAESACALGRRHWHGGVERAVAVVPGIIYFFTKKNKTAPPYQTMEGTNT